MSIELLLKSKIKSAADVAATVNSGDRVDYGGFISQPDLFDIALSERKDELRDVVIRNSLSVSPRQVIEVDPEQKSFTFECWHFSGYDRKMHKQGSLSYVPFNFGEAPDIYRRFMKVDLAVIKTTPMDEHGYFNFGVSNTYIRAILDIADRIVVETSEAVPHCSGIQADVHISEIEAVIIGDNKPLFELPSPPLTDIDRKVAQWIIPRINDGSCLQIGIGGMPNAVCSALVESDIKELGINTEMFVDNMVDLVEAGKVTCRRKQLYRGQMTFAFAVGSQRMYDFLHNNQSVMSLPVDETNLPSNIAANKNVVSINNAMQIDLSGQVSSESCGYQHVSGTGGQLQFVRGAYASEGGKSFMCLSSRFMKGDEPCSRIVLGLSPGTTVTTPRTDVMYVVTEHGIANLKGKSVPERALALIELAHPDDREGLMREARDSKMLPRRYW
jgi:acyl-CoA hydrolase